MPPIDRERWRVLSPYLDQALELAAGARAAWLAHLAATDPALAADLEALLAEHEEVDRAGYLDTTTPLAPRLNRASTLAGLVVGAYRLVAPLGQGGTGSVWKAERCDGRFQGQAAVKLLNLALVGRAIEGRFLREGTLLARLKHPNIAQLVDAGVTGTGQPYLVLELVDGRQIDRHCADARMPVDARLALFLDVVAAVAHAHANLIVHRDIKPNNVLVSTAGHVKLLDFGIATLVADGADWPGGAAVTSALTREAGAAMTPEFAAPEQLTGGPIATATDVYALGVLLYVLLTGRHPAGDVLTSRAEITRAIVERDPPRMSDAVARPPADDAQARHAAGCGSTVSRLQRTLRGDLDTIAARALKRAPAERYPSAAALADDVRRYLDREPIAARPDTLQYRLAKFVGRHTRGVAASAAAAVVLAAVIGFYTSRLAAERDRAQREATRASKVSDALTGLLMGADPIANRATGEGMTVRGLIDQGADRAQRGLVDQPEAQAEILSVLGRLYRLFGAYDRAAVLLDQALGAAERVYGAEHLRVAQTLNDLGVVSAEKGDYATGIRQLERALGMRRRLLGTDHADVAVTLVELARLYQDQGQHERGEPLQREALAIRQRVLGPDDRETAVSLSAVASVLRLKGDLDGAERLLRQSLDLNIRTRGAAHPNTGSTRHDLALIAIERHDIAGAEAELDQALAIHQQALGEVHPNVAWDLNALSHVYVARQRFDDAVAALERALAIARATYGAEHQLVAIHTANLAAVYMARGDAGRAASHFAAALEVRHLAPDLVPARRRTLASEAWPITALSTALTDARGALTRTTVRR